AIDDHVTTSMSAWIEHARRRGTDGLPEDVAAALAADDADRTPEQDTALRAYYLRRVHTKTRESLIPLEAEADALRATITRLKSQAIPLPIMRELQGDARRTTRRFISGSFLSPAEEVGPGLPEVFAASSASTPTTRLDLARWLVSPDNPLTARVLVNR